MFVPATFAAAISITILCSFCWGWCTNSLKFTKNWRFELSYWDYALGILLVTLQFAFTLGSAGCCSFSFWHYVRQTDGTCLLYALADGFIFYIANVLLTAGIEIAGLAVAFPPAIGIAFQ